MNRFFAVIAAMLFALAAMTVSAITVLGASPVNVTIVPEVVNVTVEQEGAPAVTVTTTVGEVMNVVTAGEQGIPGLPGASSWNDLTDKPTIPAAQVPADWNSIIDPTQILNKPVIPEACGSDPANAIFDGAPALSCAIDSGVLAVSYDALGANPLPAMLPYTVKLYEVGLNNNEPVTPDTIKWSVPASNSLLVMGQYSTQSSFTPTIAGNYSAGTVNWIKAVLTRGLKTCIALIPVSVTKTGATGEKGVPGDGASISIGTTTTVAYGNPAAVRFRGTSTARIADFDIPEGAPGAAADITKDGVLAVFDANHPGGTSFTVMPSTATGQTNANELITARDLQGNKTLVVTGDSTTLNTVSGTSSNILTVNKIFPGYGVPLTNAWSERFTAIRTNDTVAVTAGKTYTETLTVFADGTITAASINFRTPNGDHIVPAYVTGSQSGGYTLTATYTTETGGTTIRMPDITYLAGTVANITITAASLVQQKTNLITDAAALSGIYSYTAAHNSPAVAQSDGSYRMNKVNAWSETFVAVRRDLSPAKTVSSSTSYTAEVIFRHDGTAAITGWEWIMGLTPSGARQTGSAASLTDLGNGFKKLTATRTTASDEISVLRFPEWNGAYSTGTFTYYDFISTKLTLDSEAAPPTTNLYTGSYDDLYHYTAAHTTNATPQTGSVVKLTVSPEGAMTLW